MRKLRAEVPTAAAFVLKEAVLNERTPPSNSVSG